MTPTIKYTLGRLGLFLVFFAALLPLPLHVLVKAMLALVLSAVASLFLLRAWRDEVAQQWAGVAQRRQAERARLRAALAGDEAAATEGDRAADPPRGEG